MTVDAQLRRRSSIAVNLVLFLATVVTTVWAGALHQGGISSTSRRKSWLVFLTHHDRLTFTRTESAVSCKTDVESRQA
jgi:hypothetical protein